MDASILILWLAAAILGLATLRKGRDRFVEGLKGTGRLLKSMAIRLPVALILAGFLAQLLPNDVIAAWTGAESGVTGVLIAAYAGGLVPSGPFVSFPVAYTLHKAGVGLPQSIAFLTGWSVLAFHRVITWEWPLMGLHFSALRLAASILIPPLVGLLALAAYAALGL